MIITLKTKDGNDPSPENPIYVKIGGKIRAVNKKLSVTNNVGVNLNNKYYEPWYKNIPVIGEWLRRKFRPHIDIFVYADGSNKVVKS